jgi:hypothetical protein
VHVNVLIVVGPVFTGRGRVGPVVLKIVFVLEVVLLVLLGSVVQAVFFLVVMVAGCLGEKFKCL